MRGNEERQDAVFSYVSLEQRVPADHPLRRIRSMVDEGCNAGAAEPCYLGRVLAENQHGLIVGACVTEAGREH